MAYHILGDKVGDKLTGFVGTVVARVERDGSTDRYAVQAHELHNGVPVEEQWFDSDRLIALPDETAISEEPDDIP